MVEQVQVMPQYMVDFLSMWITLSLVGGAGLLVWLLQKGIVGAFRMIRSSLSTKEIR